MTQLKVQIIPVTPIQQNASLIYDPITLKGAVVDPGGDLDDIIAAIDQLGIKVEKILLTHGHFDHAGGAEELSQRLGVVVEGPHEGDKFLLDRLAEDGPKYGIMEARAVTPSRWLSDGDTVEIAGNIFQVLHVPGHSPGSVVFFNEENRFAVMGDVLFQGAIGRTDFPYGSEATLLSGIEKKILPLGDDVTFLPGHGSASQIGIERQHNPFLKRFLR